MIPQSSSFSAIVGFAHIVPKNLPKTLLLEYSAEAAEALPLPAAVSRDIASRMKKSKSKAFSVTTPIDDFFGCERLVCGYIPKDASFDDYFRHLASFVRTTEGDIAVRFNVERFDLEEGPLLAFVEAVLGAAYTFDAYKTKKKEREITLLFPNALRRKEELKAKINERIELCHSVWMARDLANAGSSDIRPSTFASYVMGMEWKRTKVSVVSTEALTKMGAGLALGVGRGSTDGARFMVFTRMVDKNLPTIALVGKGVTFDSGGLQIKPGDAMLDMKGDMGGAAAVLGAMRFLDTVEDPSSNVVAVCPLVENMVDSSAYRPGDVLTALDGTTVEIGHTDAEGRLILGDAIGYVEKTFPDAKTIYTIATLTGACMVALGYNYAGVFSQEDRLAKRFIEASETTLERYWRLPLDDDMFRAIKSDIADIKNVGGSYKAGASTGAAFVAHFAKKTKIVHIDIAGPALRSSASGAFNKGGTGFGAITLGLLARNG